MRTLAPMISRRLMAAAAAAAVAVPLTAAAGPAASTTDEAPQPTRTISSAGNPIIADGSYYMADAAPLVVGDTMYIYGGHDEAAPQQAAFEMHEYGVLNTTDVGGGSWDLYEGNMKPGEVFDWASGNGAYAGQVVPGKDGRYYWYAPVESADTTLPNRMAIGVAVADSPVGPWTDAIGEPLLNWRDVFGDSTTGQELIDPHVFTDTDGTVYLYWGSWSVARVVELAPSMTALAGEIRELDGLDGFYEAPWVLRRGDTYYMLYDWKVPGSECTPSNYQACVAYATATNPYGPWEYQGIILGGTSSTTVHPSLIEFGDNWYLTYHTADSDGGGHFRRSVAIDEVQWDGGTILPVQQTWAQNPAFELSTNAATGAQLSASYTESPPMRLGALNDGRVTTAMLPPDEWGNYRGTTSTVASDWVMYTWDTPVRIGGMGIEFHRDSNWIRPPQSWQVEYVGPDGSWHPLEGADYPTTTDTWHDISFPPVTTTALRATFTGRPEGPYYHSVAVSEWEVDAAPATALTGIEVTTKPGQEPELPEAVRLPFADAGDLWVPVNWHSMPAADYESAGTFAVNGRALGQAEGNVQATVTVTDEPPQQPPADEEAPEATTSVSGNPGGEGWYSSPVTVRISGQDERDYLLNLAGRIGEGEWQQVEDARHLDLTIEREGSTTVTARAADAAGNTSEVQRPVRIDTTAPELSVPFEAESRTVTVTADDELSGLARLEYRLDDDAWSPVPDSGLVQVDDLPHELFVRAADVAGNTNQLPVQIPPAEGAELTGNLAPYAEPEASFTADWESVGGLNDGDNDLFEDNAAEYGLSWGTWSQVGEQWATLTWDFEVTVDEVGVWWYRDSPDEANSGMIPPRSWVLQYRNESGQWQEVTLAADGQYGRRSDGFQRVAFDPVSTRSLRIVAQAWGNQEGGGSVGIREWQVAAAEQETPQPVTVTAQPRCMAGNVALYVQVSNQDPQVEFAGSLNTPYGQREMDPLAPGESAAAGFNTRMSSIPSGEASFTSPGLEVAAAYPEMEC